MPNLKNLKSFLVIFAFLLLYQTEAKADSTTPDFSLFSEKLPLSPGFFWVGLEVYSEPGKLLFSGQELIYHPNKGWEEWIYRGEIQKEREAFLLSPKDCQVRANSVFESKKGIVRRFDCEHLLLKLTGEPGNRTLDRNLSGSFSAFSFPIEIPGDTGLPRALVIDLPSGEEGIWGFHLNGIKSDIPDLQWNQVRKVWEKRDSSPKGKKLEKQPLVFQWKRTFSN